MLRNYRKRSFKVIQVIDFVTNGKSMYDFLLTNNSNYGSVSRRFKDMATHMLKISDFCTPVPFDAPAAALPYDLSLIHI